MKYVIKYAIIKNLIITYFNLHGLRGQAKSQNQESNGSKGGLHGGSWQQVVLQLL